MEPTPPPIPEHLAEHIDQLLAGTGLAHDAVLATARGDAGTDALADPQVVDALRAGWTAADAMGIGHDGPGHDDRDDTEERRT